MLNNSRRFKLPPLSMIGGATKTFKIPLQDIFGQTSVIHCNNITNDTAVDENGYEMVADCDCVYLVTNKETGETSCYLWDGVRYNSASCVLSVSAYTGANIDLVIERECPIEQDVVLATFCFEDTIRTSGKFIYQIAVCSNVDQAVRYFLEQGTLIVSRNIDIMENILNGSEDDFIIEDENISIIYEEVIAYVVGVDVYANDWLSDSDGGNALIPNELTLYIVESGEYEGKYTWDADILNYKIYEY